MSQTFNTIKPSIYLFKRIWHNHDSSLEEAVEHEREGIGQRQNQEVKGYAEHDATATVLHEEFISVPRPNARKSKDVEYLCKALYTAYYYTLLVVYTIKYYTHTHTHTIK